MRVGDEDYCANTKRETKLQRRMKHVKNKFFAKAINRPSPDYGSPNSTAIKLRKRYASCPNVLDPNLVLSEPLGRVGMILSDMFGSTPSLNESDEESELKSDLPIKGVLTTTRKTSHFELGRATRDHLDVTWDRDGAGSSSGSMHSCGSHLSETSHSCNSTHAVDCKKKPKLTRSQDVSVWKARVTAENKVSYTNGEENKSNGALRGDHMLTVLLDAVDGASDGSTEAEALNGKHQRNQEQSNGTLKPLRIAATSIGRLSESRSICSTNDEKGDLDDSVAAAANAAATAAVEELIAAAKGGESTDRGYKEETINKWLLAASAITEQRQKQQLAATQMQKHVTRTSPPGHLDAINGSVSSVDRAHTSRGGATRGGVRMMRPPPARKMNSLLSAPCYRELLDDLLPDLDEAPPSPRERTAASDQVSQVSRVPEKDSSDDAVSNIQQLLHGMNTHDTNNNRIDTDVKNKLHNCSHRSIDSGCSVGDVVKTDDGTDVLSNSSRSTTTIKSDDDVPTKSRGLALNESDILAVIERHLHATLDGQSYVETRVKDWCKEISNNIRDDVKSRLEEKCDSGHMTACAHKVVVSTFIGSREEACERNTVHVSVRNERCVDTDSFVTLALQADTLHAWVTLLVV